MVMPFGKHRGEPVEDVPTDYLEWFLGEVKHIDPRLQEEMEAQLAGRRGEGIVRKPGRP